MKNAIQLVKETARYFMIITVLVLFVSASYISIFYGLDVHVTVKLLWQILFVSFLASLSHIFFRTEQGRTLSKNAYYIRWLLCYIYVNAAVLSFGWMFEWFDISSLPMVVGMLIAILFLATGLLCAARLWLNRHTPAQLLAGFFNGFFSVLLFSFLNFGQFFRYTL